jgi:hypothetical protein
MPLKIEVPHAKEGLRFPFLSVFGGGSDTGYERDW